MLGRYRAKFLDIAWKSTKRHPTAAVIVLSHVPSHSAADLGRPAPHITPRHVLLCFLFAPEFDQQLDKTLGLLEGNEGARVVDDRHFRITT